MLTERGEDYSKRASATSDYLLAGLIICDRSGCYTCRTCQRYGTKHCDAERLPADEMDAAVLALSPGGAGSGHGPGLGRATDRR